MLLLVMKAERDDRLDLGEQRFISFFDQLTHALIDRFAEPIRFSDGRPRNQSAEIAPVHVARRIVVRIEKISILRDFRAIPRHPDFDDKGFEKPTRVGEMPLCWAHVRHGLHHAVFRFEIASKAGCECAHLSVLLEQPLPSPVRFARSLDFVAAARRLGHESLGRFQDDLAFLFQLFLAGLDHLIVLRFLDAFFDKLLADALFVFDPRCAVST